MKNIWNNFYENKILRILVHQPLKALAHILSDGGFHLLMCITVFLLTFFLVSEKRKYVKCPDAQYQFRYK